MVVAKIATTISYGTIAGKAQTTDSQFYNLDAIILVGYRFNFRRATRFRIWATSVLREYMTKDFAMDDERREQGKTVFGTDYFRELLERVHSIRASERRISRTPTLSPSAALTMIEIPLLPPTLTGKSSGCWRAADKKSRNSGCQG
ncbi:RhuM family protein [uncultured Dysosmobacter sp.]|uniref:RhuM family protein n=1 Tax=uncultured Dysosmobacter sp. TaxID=2591384 RepID=UPI0026179D97|nr:RhuM family protein [uncultured Dysosmobacter sp.]